MRASYYNVLAKNPIDQGYLLFNTLNGALCTLSDEEGNAYRQVAQSFEDAGSDSDDVGGEANVPVLPADLEEALAGGGFVLADPEQEASYLEYQYDLYKYNTDVLELTIAPTLDCNNECIYCYETSKRPGSMSPAVQDRVMAFVAEQFEALRFKKLKVSWFGGEPLLYVDIIESLSQRFIEFCDTHDVAYIAHVVSNCTLADEVVARRLARCRVSSAMPSLDGIGCHHDCRRRSRSGEATYDLILSNIQSLADEGIVVNASFLLDRSNFEDFHQLGAELLEKPNVLVRCTQLHDYHGDIDAEDADKIELATREEYSWESFRFFMETRPTASDFEEALAPLHVFCGTPLANWWVIDELGGVYKCIGEIGEPDRRIFDLMDSPDDRDVNWEVLLPYVNSSPVRDELCRTCSVLPLCQGECAYERAKFKRNCRTLRTTIEAYVQEYYRALCKEDAGAEAVPSAGSEDMLIVERS